MPPKRAATAKRKPSRKKSAKKKTRRKPAPKPVPPPAPPPPQPSSYDRYRDQQAQSMRRQSESGRDIGPCPDIADVERRESCRFNLKLFCDTYNPAAFAMPWSPNQVEEIGLIQEAVLAGALAAHADPRADGKTTRCRMALLWAIGYAHRRYAFLIGANAPKAESTLAAVKTYIRFMPLFVADFPEIAYPIARLEGIPNRAAGQTSEGRPTLIKWSEDRVILPTIMPPENWPAHWPRRADGAAPTSGSLLGCSGLTGEGIRGSVETLADGTHLRPDFVLLDDPQTPESARSPLQNRTRRQLVAADVLGMAGPGKKIAAVMPCTVIAPGDFIDHILDHKEHPEWRGRRTSILASMPTNLKAWDDYFDVYKRCLLKTPQDFAEANDYYIEHRATLDDGAEATWPARKADSEVSAVQHAMNLLCTFGREAFWAEYMNRPLTDELQTNARQVELADLAAKLNNLPRGVVPRHCTRLTAFIDVGVRVHHYLVAAWNERFGGAVIDYGAFPRQNSPNFTAADPRPSLFDAFPGMSESAVLYAGLKALADDLFARHWPQEETEAAFSIERIMIDSGYKPEIVFRFIREHERRSALIPSKGYGVTMKQAPVEQWAQKQGEQRLFAGKVYPPQSGKGRWVQFDTNRWKSMVAERLLSPMGERGTLAIFGGKADLESGRHAPFFEHLTSEYRQLIVNPERGRRGDEWAQKVGYSNHWWDCITGAAVAANVCGLQWPQASAASARPARPKLTLEEMAQRGQEMPTL